MLFLGTFGFKIRWTLASVNGKHTFWRNKHFSAVWQHEYAVFLPPITSRDPSYITPIKQDILPKELTSAKMAIRRGTRVSPALR